MSNYQYQADWSRTVKDTGWIKMSSNIILIQDRKSGEFACMLEGNLRSKESHIQKHHDSMDKDEYTNMRIISYDGDNLKSYEKGMKEICETVKFQGGYVSTLKGDDRRYIGENGQGQTFNFVKTDVNNSQYIGVYCYQVDMQKVRQLKNQQQQQQSTWTTTYISHGKPEQTKEKLRKETEQRKRVLRSERECREQRQIALNEKYSRQTALNEKHLQEKQRKEKDFYDHYFNTPDTNCECIDGYTTVVCWKCKESRASSYTASCTMCNGSGEIHRKCAQCKGFGVVVRWNMDGMCYTIAVNSVSLDDFKRYQQTYNKYDVTWVPFEERQRERQRKAVRMEREKQEQARKEKMEKTYTIVYAEGATVRNGKDLSSTLIGVVDFHSVVIVEEVDGRRCRISDPYNGWVSLCTVDGKEILQKGILDIIQQKQCCNIL